MYLSTFSRVLYESICMFSSFRVFAALIELLGSALARSTDVCLLFWVMNRNLC